jgi:hypothetical protein
VRHALAALALAAFASIACAAHAAQPATPPPSGSPIASATPSASPTATPEPTPLPAELVVRGQVLAIDDGFLVFTTGDAVQLGAATVPPGLTLGRTVRVRIDTASRAVVAIEADTAALKPGEIEASALPRELVAVDPRSAQTPAANASGGTAGAGQVTVKIDVHVPDVTPPTDDVYLSTDRTAYSAAELRMNRVDALDWTIELPLPAGTTLRYEFTRGAPSTVERARDGTLVTPRTIVAASGAAANDVVARWADKF